MTKTKEERFAFDKHQGNRPGVNLSFLDNRLSWNAQQGWGNGAQADRSSLYLSYQGSEGSANMGYSNGGGSKNFNYGINGAVLVHPHGVKLARSLSDSRRTGR
ncbi:fimbria/pilus outer membrane usher protein [Enterobacter roggenkampii]